MIQIRVKDILTEEARLGDRYSAIVLRNEIEKNWNPIQQDEEIEIDFEGAEFNNYDFVDECFYVLMVQNGKEEFDRLIRPINLCEQDQKCYNAFLTGKYKHRYKGGF
jgi:hypothetical protein